MSTSEELQSFKDSIVVRRRSSLFRSGLSSSSPNTTTGSAKIATYEQQLNREILDWGMFMQEQYKKIKELEQTRIVLDDSILSAEQKSYLSRGTSVKEHMKASKEFRAVMEVFVHYKMDIMKQYQDVLLETKSQIDTETLDWTEDQFLSQEIE